MLVQRRWTIIIYFNMLTDEDDASTIYQQGTPEELMGKIWYHGRISHKMAKTRLKAESSDCFLLRDSTTSPGGFSLSLKYHGAIKHFIMDRDIQSDEYVVHGTKKSFPSIPELIDHYMHHPISAGGETLWMPCLQEVSSMSNMVAVCTSWFVVLPQNQLPLNLKCSRFACNCCMPQLHSVLIWVST